MVKFLENSVVINDNLVLTDLHLGRDDYIETSVFEKLDEIFEIIDDEKIKIKKIVLLGDLKHEFSGISDGEWRTVIKLLDYLTKKIGESKNIIVLKGNHDTILEPILNKRGIKLRDYYKSKNICFIHGDRFFEECDKSEVLVMGHLHPSITLSDKYKNERYRCFLYGKWKGKKVLILPSFSPMSYGYNLNNLDSYKKDFGVVPNKSLKKFEVIIYNNKDKKEHNFGKLNKYLG